MKYEKKERKKERKKDRQTERLKFAQRFRRTDARSNAGRHLRIVVQQSSGGDVPRFATFQFIERSRHLQFTEVKSI